VPLPPVAVNVTGVYATPRAPPVSVVPAGAVIESGARIVMVKLEVPGDVTPSVACTVTGKEPATDGVPLMRPVLVPRESPVGSAPLEMLQE